MGLATYNKDKQTAAATGATAEATAELLQVTRSLYVEQRETNQWLKRIAEALEKS